MENNENLTNSQSASQSSKNIPVWLIALIGVISVAIIIVVFVLMLNKPDSNNDDNGGGITESTVADYTVTVVDEIGNPMSNVMVHIFDENDNTKKNITDKNGKVVFAGFNKGENKITLEQGFSEALILASEYVFDKNSTELCVIVRNQSLVQDIFGEVNEGAVAYAISAGEYSVSLSENSEAYYVFMAKKSGVYKFSVVSSDENVTLGYYGNPMFVQSNHRADGAYDGKIFEMIIQDIATPYVLGIKNTDSASVKLVVERISDPPFDPIHEEWTEVVATQATEVCDTTGKTLVDLDISNSTLSVTLGNDGYYYTNKGKLVYIRITTTTGHGKMNEELQFVPVMNGSLALIAGYVDENVGLNVGGFVYDESGNFVAKYRYNEMIKSYMDCVDGTYGVVPLTAELAECIKLHGSYNGWWDKDDYRYLFEGVPVNLENVWLFLCMVEK